VLLVLTLLLVRGTLNPPGAAQEALADFALAAGGASAGSLCAALAAPRATRLLGLRHWTGLTLVAAGLGAPAAIATLALPMLVAGSFLMGFAGQAVKIAGDTLLQRHIDDDHRGRVFALYDVVLNLGLVGGITVAALLAPPSGVAPGLFLAVGALLLATAAWSLRPAAGSG
jgi:hypothetical protein